MRKRLFAGLLTLVMIMSLVPMPALAVEDDTVVVSCTKTEGCILADGHEGDCVLSDEPEGGDSNGYYEFEDVTDPVQPTAEEQLAGMIENLPDPSEINPLDEEQVEAVYNQISAIYAFAEENGLGDRDNGLLDEVANATVNDVIAALNPIEQLAISGLSGNGTASDPYIIDSADDLAKIPNGTTAYFKQTAALDLSNVSIENAKSYISGTFSGVYDGDNKAITGAKLPLFNYVKGTESGNAQIKNINLSANVGTSDSVYSADALTLATTPKSVTASGAGLVTNYAHLATFENCTISGTLYASGNTGVGSLVGHSGTITVTGCSSSADITSSSYGVGGLIGFCQNANWSTAFGSISGCQISSSSYSGTMTLSDSTNGQNPIYGGVIGVVSGAETTSKAQVSNCTFAGTMNITSINSNAAAGGIVGTSFPKDAAYNYCTVQNGASISLPDTVSNSICVGGIIGGLVRHATISNATISGTLPTSSYQIVESGTTKTTKGVVAGKWIGYFNSNNTTNREDGMLVLSNDIIANTGALTGGVVPSGVTLASNNLLPISGAGNAIRLVVENGGTIGAVTVEGGIASLDNAGTVESISATYIGNDGSNKTGVKNSGTIGSLTASSTVVVLENTGTISSVKSTGGQVRLCTSQENGTIESVEASTVIHVGVTGAANKNTLSSLKAANITFYETNTGALGTIEATGVVSGLTTQAPSSVSAGNNRLVVVNGEVSNYHVVYNATATISAGSDGNYTIKDGDSDESGTSVSADTTLIFAQNCTLTIDSSLSSAVSVGDIQAAGNLTINDNSSSGSHAIIKSITTNGGLTMDDYYGTVSGNISAGGNISIAGNSGLSGTIGTSNGDNAVATTNGNITIKLASDGTLNSDVKNTGTGNVSVTNSNTGKTVASNITAEQGTVSLKGYNAPITSALFSGDIYAEKGLTVTYNLAPISEDSAIDVYLGDGATIQLVETNNGSQNAGAYLKVQSKNSENPVQSLTINKGSSSSSGLNAVTIDITSISETLTTIINNVTDTNLSVKATIKLDANGGTGTKTENYTTSYSLSSVNGIGREGYTLAGWTANADGTGKSFGTSDTVSLSNWASILYAKWTVTVGTDTYYVTPVIDDQTYKGEAIEPAVIVTKNGTTISEGYTVEYENNTNVGTATAIVKVNNTEIGRATFAIKKATLTITVDNQTIYVGGTLPTVYTYTVTGLVGTDTESVITTKPTVTCSATDTSAAGTYTITASEAKAGENYTITYVSGTLTVQARTGGNSHSGGGSSSSTTYTVTVDSTKNGTVSVSPKNASKGTTVTVTVKPNSGYELDRLTVTDKAGKTVKITEGKNGQYTFTMPAGKVNVEASFAKIEEQPSVTFTDVPTSAYYYDAVEWAVENGITNGTSATTFSPDATCTRAQTVTFLWRAAGSPAPKNSVNPFTDVQPGAYYYEAVLWAVENGITNGTSATTFGPDDTVTRGQTVTFQHRAAGSPAVGGDSFADVAADAYYAPAVQWAVANGITNGTSSTTFSPDAPCTRGQIVTFLYRDMAE